MADNPKDVGIWVGAGIAVLTFFGVLWKMVRMMVEGDMKQLAARIDQVGGRMDSLEKSHELMASQRTADMAAVKAELAQVGKTMAVMAALDGVTNDSVKRIERHMFEE